MHWFTISTLRAYSPARSAEPPATTQLPARIKKYATTRPAECEKTLKIARKRVQSGRTRLMIARTISATVSNTIGKYTWYQIGASFRNVAAGPKIRNG